MSRTSLLLFVILPLGLYEWSLVQARAVPSVQPQATEVTTSQCVSTTMDGLPNCPMPKMSAAKCLRVYPPDHSGGFCQWYGYATEAQEDRFEHRRGFVRVKRHDTIWRPVTAAARRRVACWKHVMQTYDYHQKYGPDLEAICGAGR